MGQQENKMERVGAAFYRQVALDGVAAKAEAVRSFVNPRRSAPWPLNLKRCHARASLESSAYPAGSEVLISMMRATSRILTPLPPLV